MRMFVALRPPADAVEDLEDFLDVRRAAAAYRWTDPEQVHLTLAFLADVPERSLDALDEGLAAATARRRPVAAAIAGGGAFPDAARSKVLWAGLALSSDDAEELDRLAAGVRTAAARAGLGVDGQRFRPHLTIARLPRPEDTSRWLGVLDTYRGPAFEIAEVELVASHLGQGRRGRPRHEVLATHPVGRGRPM